MPAVLIRRLVAALTLVTAPAFAIGLGPLTKEGSVAGSRKAFYLTIVNPENGYNVYMATAIDFTGDEPAPRVTVFPSRVRLGGHQHRQILVIADGLTPGETYRFRVCAERAQIPEGTTIHARVCSKLTARRLPGSARADQPLG